MVVKDKAILQITATTTIEVMVAGVDMDRIKGKIPTIMRSLNASYVVNLIT